MRKYSLSKLSICVALATVVASCTKVDDTLGQDFIPKNQMMDIDVTSDFEINTYNVTIDSTISDYQSYNYLGSYLNSVTGSVSAEVVMQMGRPYFGTDNKDTYFGTDPVIDSLFMVLTVNGVMGKSEVEQTFDIYEMTQPIYIDSTYYTNFDPTGMYSTTPIGSFTHSGKGTSISQEITDQSFINRLKNNTIYGSDTLFHRMFKGLYLKSRTPNADAAVYTLAVTSSYLRAYYHNMNETPDTLSVLFMFGPNTSNNVSNNQNINIIKYDYSTAAADLRIDDKTTPASRTFVQGYGGLSTLMEFSKESVDKIKKSVRDRGYSEIVINKAKLEVEMPNHDPSAMNLGFGRLGIYTDQKHATPIPDYNYTAEANNYTIPYGGYMNRSLYRYEMDISAYVQRLFRDEYDVRGVTLAPSKDEYFTLRNIELGGAGSANPIKLTITYTMVK